MCSVIHTLESHLAHDWLVIGELRIQYLGRHTLDIWRCEHIVKSPPELMGLESVVRKWLGGPSRFIMIRPDVDNAAL